MNAPSKISAYHCTSSDLAADILAAGYRSSDNDYNWLNSTTSPGNLGHTKQEVMLEV